MRWVRVAASASGVISRILPGAETAPLVSSETVNSAYGFIWPIKFSRNVENSLSHVGPGNGHDRLPSANDLPRLGIPGGNYALIVGAKLGIADLFLRLLQACQHLVEPGLGRLTVRDGSIDLGLHRATCRIREKLLLPVLGGLRVNQGCARIGDLGLRGGEREAREFWIERSKQLASRHQIADVDVARDHPAPDLEARGALIAGLDRSLKGPNISTVRGSTTTERTGRGD